MRLPKLSGAVALLGLVMARGNVYNCDLGCKLIGPSVCGADGVTYADECLAFCQDVKVSSRGACPSDRSQEAAASRILQRRRPQVVSKSRMSRFANEGFKYVGHQNIRSNGNMEPRTMSLKSGANSQRKKSSTDYKEEEKRGLTAVRITSQGDEYRTSFRMTLSGGSVSSDPFAPLSHRRNESRRLRRVLLGENMEEDPPRGLRVFGTDDRVRIMNTKIWPYPVFGQLSGDGSCSGTVISFSSVVTAAHCVYNNDPRVKKWTGMTMFHPGRNGSDFPFGTWTSDYRTTFLGWINHEGCSLGTCETDAFRWDLAVMTLNKKDNKYIGEVTGWAGFQSLSPKSAAFDHSTITGFPGDKPLGTMWKSWNCPDGFWKDPDHHPVIRYLCDIVQGSSGSSIMTRSYRVVGVVAFQQRQFNGGNYFDSARARSLELWSHRGTSGVVRTERSSHQCWSMDIESKILSLTSCYYGSNQQFYWLSSTHQIKSIWSRHYCLEYRSSETLHFKNCTDSQSQQWYRNEFGQLKSRRSRKRCLRYENRKNRLRMHKCRRNKSQRFIFPDRFWT